MKSIVRLAWLAPLLALGIGWRAAAQDAPLFTGKVLILANERVLEGDIIKIGAQYQIRRGLSETLIDADRAKRLCRDWDDALAYMRSQANLGDADERLRLARWCRQHDLREQALIEAKAALDMRPTHAETKQFTQMLERMVKPAPTPSEPSVGQAPAERKPALDVSADTLAYFATKVQPILMNTCASCHVHGRGGEFQLQFAADAGARAATQRNLMATMPFLKLEQPSASPFLAKAVSAHGDSPHPPIRDRRAVPFQTLQHWVEQAAANNPHLQPQNVVAASVRSATESAVALPAPMPPASAGQPVISRPVARVEPATAPVFAASAEPAPLSQQSPVAPKSEANPLPPTAATPNLADRYDPFQFNNTARK
jgi:hypothetical protein